jgi:hypothetical protein
MNLKLNILKFIAITVFVATLLPLFLTYASAADEISGSCGVELTWSYDCGTLTITGKGKMSNFSEVEMAPWYHLRDKIVRVVLPEGLTSIGALAFYECSRLQHIVLPESILYIESNAFAFCTSLKSIYIGEGLRTIGFAAFYGCNLLDSVRLPYGLESVGEKAFYMCESLTTITLREGLTYLGDSAFAYCKNLIKAEIYGNITKIPDWTFYGCDMLASIVLPATVTSIGDFAFRKCETLSVVYYSGSKATQNTIKQEINSAIYENTVANISVLDTLPPDNAASSNISEDNYGNLNVENITAKQNEQSNVVSIVTGQKASEEKKINTYYAVLNVTVESAIAFA